MVAIVSSYGPILQKYRDLTDIILHPYHLTGPVCRYELETDDAVYETERRDRMLKRKMRFRLDELRAKKVSQLRDLSTILIVSLVGCIDKQEVIERLLASGMIELIEGAPAIEKTRAEFEAMGVRELRYIYFLVLFSGLFCCERSP